MSRSKWKGPYISPESIKTDNSSENKQKKIISRNSEITPKFLGLSVNVHNGKEFLEINVTDDMIGHKAGEFASTRARFSFKKKKSKK